MSAGRSYRSYLLRIWRTSGAGGSIWRVVLQDVRNERHFTFTTLSEMLSYLERQVDTERADTDEPFTYPEPEP